jgi:peptide/nickel transport system substrate-binding protein
MKKLVWCIGAAAAALALAPSLSNAQPANAPKVPGAIGYFKPEEVKPEVGKYGGRLVRDELGEPKSFNPITAGETSTTDFTDRIFQGLTDENPWSGEIEGCLAEKWEVAADKKTWTFHLRKDVTFNDGTKFTADDVTFSWNDCVYDLNRPDTAKEPRWPCSGRDVAQFNGQIFKVEKVDDYTVKITTPVPIAILPRLAAQQIIPKAKYGKFVADGTFGGAMAADSKSGDIVGTGPWMLGSYTRGQNVTLKRNPNYWKKDAAGNKLPYLDEQVWLITRDLNLMLVNFKQGTTDTYSLSSGKDIPELKRAEKLDFKLYQLGPAHGMEFLALNCNMDAAKKGKFPEYRAKWFGDVRFRKAVAYAIDRQAIVRNILRNLGYPQLAPYSVAPGPYFQEGFPPYPHDLDKAKALLDEMGLKMGSNGVRVDSEGHEVAFTITTNAGNTNREAYCDFIRKDLEQIGIHVNALPLEFNALIDKLDNTYDWEGVVMGFTGGWEPNDGANFWRSSARYHMWWPEQKTPQTAWEKEIDEIFDNALQELDTSKRKALFHRWTEIIRDEQPVICLVTNERVGALRDRFGNVMPSPWPEHGKTLLQLEEYLYVK